jgi:hypothetical protein
VSLLSPKVFGVGFHKTGTTSLADALSLLGYTTTGPNDVHREGIDRAVAWRTAQALLPRFDAFQDNPWPLLFREIDRELPGSLFVLTERPDEEWLASVVRHFGRERTPMREWIYGEGSPVGHEDRYLERYRRHNREVREHFAGREDLLVMDITRGDGWELLCTFLGHAVPEEPFPHSNPAGSGAAGPIGRFRRRLSAHGRAVAIEVGGPEGTQPGEHR